MLRFIARSSALAALLFASRLQAQQAAPDPPPAAEEEEPIELTVAGTPLSRTAGSAHVVNQKQLQRFEHDDAHAVLQQVPGVQVRQEDGIGLRPNIAIRGANPDRSKKVTLMEDGVLLGPAPYSAPAAYYFPLVTRMAALRVVKGPSAITHGPQTVGGAVDLVTRSIPGAPAGSLDLAGGDYGYRKAHGWFGSSDERTGFLIEGVRLQDTGFKVLPNGADTGSTRNEWMAKFSYLLDPLARSRNEFALKVGYSDEVSNETYLGLTDDDFRADPNQRYAASALDQMKHHRTAIVLSHTHDSPSGRLRLRSDVYRNDFTRSWRKVNHFRGLCPADMPTCGGASIAGVLAEPDDPINQDFRRVLTGEADSATGSDTLLIGPNAREFVSQGLQSKLEYRAVTGPLAHALEAGLRLHQDQIERRHSETGYLMIDGQLVPEGSAELVTEANFERTHALAVHVADAVTWKRTTVTPGIRVELIESSSNDHLLGSAADAFVVAVMPGVGVYQAVSDEFGVLGGVYRGFSPPPPASAEHVGPEYSVNYEFGSRYSDGPARIELIGFYNDYSNLTDICTLSSGCLTSDLDRQFDAGRARIYGLEAFAAHELPLGPVTLPFTLSYTLTQARFSNTFTSRDPIYGSVRDGDDLPYVPEHQLGATVGVDHERAGGGVSLSYVSPMREAAGDEPLGDVVATDELFVVDVSARVLVFGPFSVYGNVRNLLGDQYIVSRRPYGARPNAPRWFQAGAKLAF
jgi:Fe(3+) dicitrate transport protein